MAYVAFLTVAVLTVVTVGFVGFAFVLLAAVRDVGGNYGKEPYIVEITRTDYLDNKL